MVTLLWFMLSWFWVSPDVAWIEVKSLFIELVILVWTMDLTDFKTQTRRISCFVIFSGINTVYSLFYRMHMEKVNGLIQFFGYSWQGDCCCREDISRRQSRRKKVARNKEEENEEAEMKKEKKKVRVWDLNRSITGEAQSWEKFTSNQAGLSL